MEPGSLRESPAGSGDPEPGERREETPGGDGGEGLESPGGEKDGGGRGERGGEAEAGERGGGGGGKAQEEGTGGEGEEEDEDEEEDEVEESENEDEAEKELDPRIQEELEHLNQASEEINRLELQLDEARSGYRRILTDSARRLNAQGSQLGACIDKARPYYEARRLAKEAQQETQKAALSYERAVSMHNAAREMVYVAEQGLMADRNRLDPTWQEMLNHATAKVNEAEEERLRSEREHQRVTLLCQEAEARVQTLQKSLKRVIIKSKPYFELKAQFNHILEEHKVKVLALEGRVSKVKTRYSVALRNLEQISEQIHAQRRRRRRRGRGRRAPSWEGRSSPVGAESCEPAAATTTAGELGGARAPAPPPGGAARPGGEWPGQVSPSPSGLDQTDSLSMLSLQTIASDLQKCDSVEHLGDLLCDNASLQGDELSAGEEGDATAAGAGAPRGQRRAAAAAFLKHHRSVSL
ncbi:SH3 domain-binding protein 5-like [Lepisosteus oculatus]|uniref:SH3 domain-binding protein 5-like n=1 Tax=Lepisosteus oculatus TaxID=7918 RepID=UPI0035F51CF9